MNVEKKIAVRGRFQAFVRTGRTSQLPNEIGFFQEYLSKNYLLRAY